jgi:phosphoglycolate phosphatase-like HAD superfamily hydrolase
MSDIEEKIAFFKSEEKRLTEKAKQYAKKGSIDSARATMRLVTGVKETIDELKQTHIHKYSR